MNAPAAVRYRAASPVWSLILSFGLTGLAAQVAPPAAQRPTGLVGVDFLAIGADGSPIPDLTADQVTLKVDGKPRQIRSLEFVTMERAHSGTDAPVVVLPPPYGSNVLVDAARPGRAMIVVIEDESLEPGRERAMRDALTMLLHSLGPRDRVALVTVPHGGLKVDFTADREKVLQALFQIAGQAPRNESADDASCRTRNTLQALTGLLDDLTGSEAPTTVLFFSSGLTGSSPMVLPPPGQAGQTQPRVGICLLLPEVFQHVGAAAENARANFYIVPPDTSPIARPMLEGIENLAGVTGGARLALASTAEIALGRVSRETSAYYVATFAPEAAERNGLNHRVDVRVQREGVTVRTRPGVPIAQPRPSEAAVPATLAREMLRVTRVHRELPLRVAGYTSRFGADRNLRVVALAEPFEPGIRLTSAAMGLFDSGGKLVAQWSALAGDLAGTTIQAALLAPAGTYRLRAAATDQFGRSGTADYDLDANLTPAGPLLLSSLVIGLSRDGRFVPRLEYGAEASAMVQLEIYGGTAGAPIGAMLDVSDSPAGKPLLVSRLIVEPTAEPDRFIAKGTIPIGALPPGDFVVRATVEAEGQPAGRVSRTIRKRTP